MSWQDSETTPEPGPGHSGAQTIRTRSHRSDSDVSSIALEHNDLYGTTSARYAERRASVSSSASTAHGSDATISSPNQPLINGTSLYTPHRDRGPSYNNQRPEHGAVALAVEDATLAVIPAEAFRRLTKKFPKASAHIVQGELTRIHFSA